MWTDYPEVVLIALGGLVAFLMAVIYVAVRPRIAARRVVEPIRVSAGEPVRCALVVTNSSKRSSPALELTETVDGREVIIHVPDLPAQSSDQVTDYELPARPRGVYLIPPCRLARTDPLRLLNRSLAVGAETKIYVHPKVDEIPVFGMDTTGGEDEGVFGQYQGGAVFYDLRQYTPGDDARLIHWPSTARTGIPVVRNHTTPDNRERVVLLDDSERRYTGPLFEEAVRVAAALCLAATNAGARLQVRTCSGRQDSGARRTGVPADTAALDFLAEVTAHLPNTRVGSWAYSAFPEQDSGWGAAGLVVVTGHLNDRELSELFGLPGGLGPTWVVQVDSTPPGVRMLTDRLHLMTASTVGAFVRCWNDWRMR